MAADQLEKEISNSASASKLPYLENLFPSLVIVNLADVNYLIITYYHPCQSSFEASSRAVPHHSRQLRQATYYA